MTDVTYFHTSVEKHALLDHNASCFVPVLQEGVYTCEAGVSCARLTSLCAEEVVGAPLKAYLCWTKASMHLGLGAS